jgi:Holliday junction DNA helicase RuvA
MIARIVGVAVSITPQSVVVDCNGVGYEIFVPSGHFQGVKTGSEVEVHTYLVVRENQLAIYGFPTIEEKKMFLLLLSCNGVGPKMALNLTALPIQEVRCAVAEKDVDIISRVPGVGKKTASRLVLELSSKINEIPGPEISNRPEGQMVRDAIEALVALGYKADASRKAVGQVMSSDADKNVDVQTIIKKALKKL